MMGVEVQLQVAVTATMIFFHIVGPEATLAVWNFVKRGFRYE